MGWEFRLFFQRREGGESVRGGPPRAAGAEERTDVYLVHTGDVGLKERGNGGGLELKFREEKDGNGWEKWKKYKLGDGAGVATTLRALRQPQLDLDRATRVHVAKRRTKFASGLAACEETELELSLGPGGPSELWTSVNVEGKRSMCESTVNTMLQRSAAQAVDGEVLVMGYADFCATATLRLQRRQTTGIGAAVSTPAPAPPPASAGGGGSSGSGNGAASLLPEPLHAAAGERIAFKTHGFSVVVCRHPDTRKWLAVNESRQRGWWLPAGHVDRGQTFAEAAVRETQEEAGLAIELVGLLAVEHTVRGQSEHARMRVVFLAEPSDPEAPPKSEPDAESEGAAWLTRDELARLSELQPPQGLRGLELLHWATYLEQGGPVMPLCALQPEGDGPCQERWSLCRPTKINDAVSTAMDLLGV